MRHDYEVTFGGTGICGAVGAVLCGFEEVPPEPKIFKVDIPAGADIDITEAIGPVAFHNGVHRFKFALVLDGIQDRKRELMSLVHGRRADYTLSWDEGYIFTGRAEVTAIERTSDHLETATVEIDRYPWKVKTESIELEVHPTATHDIEGSERISNIAVTAIQGGTADINGTTVPFSSGTTPLAAQVYGDASVEITVSDWICYMDGHNLVVNETYIEIADENAEFDVPPFEWTEPDLHCDTSLQTVELSWTRKDL